MRISANRKSPKIDMRNSLSPVHSSLYDDARAIAAHRKALEAKQMSPAEIEAELKRVWDVSDS